MKTLLENRDTGLFLDGKGNWVTSPRDAYDFELPHRATFHCRVRQLKHVRLFWLFDDGTRSFAASKDVL